MPILANAKKALRRSKKRAIYNTRTRNKMKLAIKTLKETGDVSLLPEAYSTIDRAVKNNLLHKNKAARIKSQLSRIGKESEVKTAKPTKKAVKKAPAKKTSAKKAAPKKATKKATK